MMRFALGGAVTIECPWLYVNVRRDFNAARHPASYRFVAGRQTEIKRFMRALPRPETRVCFLLQDVEDPVNVGAAFRIADACKAEEIVLTGISASTDHRLVHKVGRGKHKRVRSRYFEHFNEAADDLKAAGWSLLAVEITPDAIPYHDVRFPPQTCLVVGHEDHGITKKALEQCDQKLFIPMYGKGASLNVHVALAVVAFQALHYTRGPRPPA